MHKLLVSLIVFSQSCNSIEKRIQKPNDNKYISVEKEFAKKYDLIRYVILDSLGEYKHLFKMNYHNKIAKTSTAFNVTFPRYSLKYGNDKIVILNKGIQKPSCTETFGISDGWMIVRNDSEYLRVKNINFIIKSVEKKLRRNAKNEFLLKGQNESCMCEPGLDSCDELNWSDDIKRIKINKQRK